MNPQELSPDRRLVALAERQDGLFTRDQAEASGLGSSARARRLEAGRWERVQPGVFRFAGAPLSWRQQLLAACLVGDRLIVSHRAAAALWGLDGVPEELVEVSHPAGARPRLSGALVHSAGVFDLLGKARRCGLPVSSVPRTLMELTTVVQADVVERALDDALRRRMVTMEHLHQSLDQVLSRKVKGAPVMRRLLELRGDRGAVPGSFTEARIIKTLLLHGLPTAQRQYEVRGDDGELLGRVDLAYPEVRVAVEIDTYRYHSSLSDWAHDQARSNGLAGAGWTILRVTPETVRESPTAVIHDIRKALQHALAVGM